MSQRSRYEDDPPSRPCTEGRTAHPWGFAALTKAAFAHVAARGRPGGDGKGRGVSGAGINAALRRGVQLDTLSIEDELRMDALQSERRCMPLHGVVTRMDALQSEHRCMPLHIVTWMDALQSERRCIVTLCCFGPSRRLILFGPSRQLIASESSSWQGCSSSDARLPSRRASRRRRRWRGPRRCISTTARSVT